MSGSFHWPGPAKGISLFWFVAMKSMIDDTLAQESLISFHMRHKLQVSAMGVRFTLRLERLDKKI